MIPQIEPITSMTRDHKSVLSKLKAGPVFLAQRSSPAAVLLSVRDYERLMLAESELQHIKRMMTADSDFAAMRQGAFFEG